MVSISLTAKHIPLPIATVSIPGFDGLIGITSCPGLKNSSGFLDLYEESLLRDLTTIRNWGAVAVVTLLDSLEMRINGVSDLPNTAEWLDLRWLHLPVDNKGIPGENFELLWRKTGAELVQLLRDGKRIVIHCKEGIGRSAIVAVRLLIELGTPAELAIKLVQKARPESLRLYSQEKYCLSLSPAGQAF